MGSRRAFHLGRTLPISASLPRSLLISSSSVPAHACHRKIITFTPSFEASGSCFSHPVLNFSRLCSTLDTVSESDWHDTDDEQLPRMTNRSSDSESDWTETEDESFSQKPIKSARKTSSSCQTEDDSTEDAMSAGESETGSESDIGSDDALFNGSKRRKGRIPKTGDRRGCVGLDVVDRRRVNNYGRDSTGHGSGIPNGRSSRGSESECSETDDEKLPRKSKLSTESESEWPETDDESSLKSTKVARKASEFFETEDDSEEEGDLCISSDGEEGKGFKSVADKSNSRGYERSNDRHVARSSVVSDWDNGAGTRKYIRDSDSDDVEVESGSEDELQAEVERQMAAEPKVVRPSVTWGILLTKEHRQTAKETVIAYLMSEGIQTSELRSIELPTTVDVMKTRLGFVRKLGLSNDDINNYPLVLGCSVRKNMVPVLRYLKKLGIKEHCVTGLLRKYPMILHASVVIDILPVIYFLRGLDIDPVDLPPVLTRYPDVLGFKTEGTMSTSVAYLVSMGVKTRHVGRMLTDYPDVLGMRVASVIKPKFEYLMSLGIPQSIVARIIERRPQILGYDLESRMKYNISQLIGIGVQQEALPGMITQFPELLGRVFSPSLELQIDWLRKGLELDLDGVSKMIEKMPQVMFLKEEVALGRIRFLKSQRFSAREIGLMATLCPQILILNIDDGLKPNLTFIVRYMKRTRQDVVEFPACLTYGLETRIRPRFKALAENHKCYSLEWLLNCSDGKFQRRLAAGFEEEDCAHHFKMGGLLPGRLENGSPSTSFTSVLSGLRASSAMSLNAGSVPSPKRDFQLVTI